MSDLADAVLAGEHRALARAITTIENRSSGYRALVSALHAEAGDAHVIGVTGPPGAGKSTLVNELAATYREQGKTVGVIAIDPASPFTGGAVLGDRIRMDESLGDMDVFVRSMSARGTLGGLATATGDAITALDAFGKDVVIVETVGAGQSEIDVVRVTDTVAVLVPPGSGDVIQTLKAGIFEIADVFVVNKADRDGVDRVVRDLRELIETSEDAGYRPGGTDVTESTDQHWKPRIVETVATDGTGVDDLVSAVDAHHDFLAQSGLLEATRRERHAATIRAVLREDLGDLVETRIDDAGGMDALAERVHRRESDPYTEVDRLLEPLTECLEEQRD